MEIFIYTPILMKMTKAVYILVFLLCIIVCFLISVLCYVLLPPKFFLKEIIYLRDSQKKYSLPNNYNIVHLHTNFAPKSSISEWSWIFLNMSYRAAHHISPTLSFYFCLVILGAQFQWASTEDSIPEEQRELLFKGRALCFEQNRIFANTCEG